jgi:predicted nucleotidyltransferase
MLKKSKNLSVLTNLLKKYVIKDIVDIILFGSAVRGKEEPGDYDICIVFREKIDLRKIRELEDILKNRKISAHLSYLTIDNFFTKKHSLASTLFLEGRSMITNKPLSWNYNLDNRTLFIYELKNMNPTDKVKFLYALKGRRGKIGILDRIKSKIVGKGVIIVPTIEEHKITSLL